MIVTGNLNLSDYQLQRKQDIQLMMKQIRLLEILLE
jgi:hypothetical protein